MPGKRPKRDFLGFNIDSECEDEEEMESMGAKRGGVV
jgi:hypothetical protein